MSIRATSYVWESVRGLSAGERLVLLSIADHQNEKTLECFPTAQRIAERTELDRMTVSRCLKKLKSKGLISVKPGTGKNRIPFHYWLPGLDGNPQWRKVTETNSLRDNQSSHVDFKSLHVGAKSPQPEGTRNEPEEGAATAAHRPRRLKATIESEDESPVVLPSLCPDDQALVAEIAEAFGKEAVSIQLIESIVRRCGHRKVRFAFERTLQSDKQLRGSRAVSYMAGIAGRLRTDELNVPAKKADGPNAGFAEAFSLATYGTRFPKRNAQ